MDKRLDTVTIQFDNNNDSATTATNDIQHLYLQLKDQLRSPIVPLKEIELVMVQTSKSYFEARNMLIACKGDIIDAILVRAIFC